VATARLVDIAGTGAAQYSVSALERHLGDFTPGRYAWFLTDIRPLPEPIFCKGARGLWEWNDAPNHTG